MTFEIDGQKYRLRFQHVNPHPHSGAVELDDQGVPRRGMTRALLEVYAPVGSEPRWDIHVEGVAWCSLGDNFNKEKGRTVAMRRLLRRCAFRGFRRAVGEAYFGR
jgi:hypothetical protein